MGYSNKLDSRKSIRHLQVCVPTCALHVPDQPVSQATRALSAASMPEDLESEPRNQPVENRPLAEAQIPINPPAMSARHHHGEPSGQDMQLEPTPVRRSLRSHVPKLNKTTHGLPIGQSTRTAAKRTRPQASGTEALTSLDQDTGPNKKLRTILPEETFSMVKGFTGVYADFLEKYPFVEVPVVADLGNTIASNIPGTYLGPNVEASGLKGWDLSQIPRLDGVSALAI